MKHSFLVGLDLGLFSSNLTTGNASPEVFLDKQIYKDIRDINSDDLEDINKIIHLAAISNDPIGNEFEYQTNEINNLASQKLFKIARESGVRKFIFASSCSVYGSIDKSFISEKDTVCPITAYAHSKANFEDFAFQHDSEGMEFTSLRFATACGASSRLRLDLAVNDFVSSAFLSKEIILNSKGNSWRPFIDVLDMCRAFHWALEKKDQSNTEKLIVNVGSNNLNYTIIDLAKKISSLIPNSLVKIKENAMMDKRSYRVNFDLYEKIAKGFLPTLEIEETTKNLLNLFEEINFNDENFRLSKLIRLNVIKNYLDKNILDKNLIWK